MGSSHTLDQLDICFDDTHAVANAGLLLAATLAERLGIEQAADALIDLGERAGAHWPGRKLLTLVHSMLAGGDLHRRRRPAALERYQPGARPPGHGPPPPWGPSCAPLATAWSSSKPTTRRSGLWEDGIENVPS
jgi:hypothetical protein